jgi:hypothetical protein
VALILGHDETDTLSSHLEGYLMRRLMERALPLAAVVAVAAVSSGCSGRPSVSVGRPYSLLDGEEIEVRGSGYPAGTTISVLQCLNGAVSIEDCNEDSVRTLRIDGVGRFATTTFVDWAFVDGHGERVDCGVERARCSIVSVSLPGWRHEADDDLYIAPPSGLVVTPNRDLADGQTVMVQGHTPTGSVRVAQCPWAATSSADCDQRTLRIPEVQDDGTFQTEMTVRSVIDSSGQPVDCTNTGACRMEPWVVSDVGEWTEQQAPIEFD